MSSSNKDAMIDSGRMSL